MQIDDILIRSCKAHDRRAQQQLYELLLPYLRAVAHRYLRDTSYVKDVLQESFIKIFKNIKQYDSKKSTFKPWAAKIVINTCFNYNKRVIGVPKEELVLTDHDIAVPPIVLQNLSDEYLLKVLKKMPEGYFEVFNLFDIDGYKHHEIAKMLSISESLSRKRLSRARIWLKKIFHKNPNLMIGRNVSITKLN